MDPQEEDKFAKWKARFYKSGTLVALCFLIWVILFICGIIWQAVAVVIVTALAVFLMHGAVARFEKLGLPRWAGTTITFILVSAIVVGAIVAFIPALVAQLSTFVSNIPTYTNTLQNFISNNVGILGEGTEDKVTDALNQFSRWASQQAGGIVSNMAGGVIGGLVNVSNIFIIAFISLVCSFWILLDLPKLTQELRSLFRDDLQDDIDIFTDAFGNAVYGWAKSTLICAVITGVSSGIAFWACGIPYAGILAFLAGMLYLIPYIGSMITCAVVAIIALIVSPAAAVASIIINVIINNVVGNVISPKLMKSSVSVHPALILVAILVGSALGGIAGMLLSIPIIGAAQGVFITYFEAHTGKTIATEDGALFQKEKKAKLPDFNTGKWQLPKDKNK